MFTTYAADGMYGTVMAGDQTRAESAALAARYARWVREEMARNGWDRATLARRSGLARQTISTIVNGGAPQPTASQVAGLAAAFGISPTDVFIRLGMWDERGGTLPRDMERLYWELGFPGRRALLGAGQAIKEMQTEYTSQPEMLEGVEPEAAHDQTPAELGALRRLRGEDADEDASPD